MLLGVLLTAYYTGRIARMKFLERRETKPIIARMRKSGNFLDITVVNNRPHNIALLDVYAKKASFWPSRQRIDLKWSPPRKIPEVISNFPKNFPAAMLAQPVYVISAESRVRVTIPDDLEEATYKICIKTSVGLCEATYQHRPRVETTIDQSESAETR